MKAADVMTRDVATCRTSETAADAARLMWDRDCGVVPVLDAEENLRGIVTDRDLLMAGHIHGSRLRDLRLSSLVPSPVVTCREDDDVETVFDIMAYRQIRRVPVIDAHDRLTGIISINDLAIRALGDEQHMKHLAKTMAAICRHRDPADTPPASPPGRR